MSNPLIARFAGEPVLVAETAAERVQVNLDSAQTFLRENAEQFAAVEAAEDFWGVDGDRWLARLRPYTVVDGVLQIPVKGVLLNNFPYQLYDWATGYEYIWEAFKRGCGDYATGAIRGIAFVSDSPGGMVAGCFDALDKMIAAKEKVGVPVAAFAHESAYSAAYATIMVADPGQIYVSRTGGVGSIGVVTSHTDMSGALEQRGLKITFIASDPSKVEGNAAEPLSADAKARIQARIDELYSIFVSAVARGRGLEESVIREDLKAYCYTATQSVSNGLADQIGSLEDATSAFAGFLDDQSDNSGDDEMTTQVETVEKAVHEKAVGDAAAAAATAMQARIGAILGSEEAKGREDLAQHFAFSTDMPAEAAVAALAKAPKAAAPEPKKEEAAAPTFEAAMSQNNPEVGAEAGKQPEADKDGPDGVAALAASMGLKGFAKPAAAK